MNFPHDFFWFFRRSSFVVRFFIAPLGFKAKGEVAEHISGVKAVSGGNLVGYSADVTFFLAFGAWLGCLFPLLPLLLFDFGEDVILNDDSKKIETSANKFFESLTLGHASSFLALRPFAFEVFVQGFKIIILNDNLISYTETKLWVDLAKVFEEHHQLISTYPQRYFRRPFLLFDVQAFDYFLDGVLFGKIFQKEIIEFDEVTIHFDGFQIVLKVVFEFVDEFGGVELLE